MADTPTDDPLDQLPQAEVKSGRSRLHLSVVWMLPLVAALIGAWVVYKDYTTKGPLINIRFDNAEGIQPGKTRIKYRDVNVGLVENVVFTEDLTRVLVNARLDKAFEDKVTASTRFWVVRPRIEGMRISGLQTLISGAYITMDLGLGGKAKRLFDGLEEPRSILSDTAGTFYQLQAPKLGGLAAGSPIYYRQIVVGEVVGYGMGHDHGSVEIDIFIRAPHDGQVRSGTRFWNVSGVEVDLSAKGLKVGVNSLAALVAGGIAFRTPQSLSVGPVAAAGDTFTLYETYDESKETAITVAQPYVLNFDDSVRGLSIGAPVEFRGLRVGTVTDIAFEGNAMRGPVRTPVIIAIEPERVPLADADEGGGFEKLDDEAKKDRVRLLMERTVATGMRARLQTGNLLTGQLYVEFDFVPDSEPAKVDYAGEHPEIPTVPSTFSGITQSLMRILAKMERLPIEEIGINLEQTTAGASRLVNSDDLQQSLEYMVQGLQRLNRVLAVFEQRADPLMLTMDQAGKEIRSLVITTEGAVKRAGSAIARIDRSIAEDGPMGRELLNTLEELSAAARSIRIMAEYLERHPEALIKGKANY